MSNFFPNSRKSAIVTNGLVAIIMRTKNRPLLLARAFASVLSQTYTNWRLCLVNDGGDARELEELVRQYLPQFGDRLLLRQHERSLGMETASNAGLSLTDSDYVVVHDDDDSWHSEFLEKAVGFLERVDNAAYGAVAARCEVIHEEIVGNRVKTLSRDPFTYWEDRIDFMKLAQNNSIPPICLLIRREIANVVGEFNPHLPVLGDWDYSLRVLGVCDIGVLNEVLSYYHHRKYEGAIYGNSVHHGVNKHLDYQVLYRNAMVRFYLQTDPSRLALLHLMSSRMQQIEEKINARIHDLHKHLDWNYAKLSQTPAWAHNSVDFSNKGLKMLSPLTWLWRKLRAIRRRWSGIPNNQK